MSRQKEVKIREHELGTTYEVDVFWHANEQTDPLERLVDAAHQWADNHYSQEREDRPGLLGRLRDRTRQKR